jgi:hypothetical protein
LLASLPLAGFSQALEESFDDISTLAAAGWTFTNQSNPIGTIDWFQGSPAAITSYNGADSAYIAVNYNSTAGAGTISNWMITPAVNVQDGDVVTFWTSTPAGSTWNDRLEVRSSTGTMTLPSGVTDVGSFTNVLLTINDAYNLSYPETWTQFTIVIAGVGTTPVAQNFAFRYNVTNGGPSGDNSNYIGIDALYIGPDGTIGINSPVASDFTYWPSLMNDVLNIRAGKEVESISAYSMVGQQVLTVDRFTEGQLNVSSLQTGAYIFRVTLKGGEVRTFKAIKE